MPQPEREALLLVESNRAGNDVDQFLFSVLLNDSIAGVLGAAVDPKDTHRSLLSGIPATMRRQKLSRRPFTAGDRSVRRAPVPFEAEGLPGKVKRVINGTTERLHRRQTIDSNIAIGSARKFVRLPVMKISSFEKPSHAFMPKAKNRRQRTNGAAGDFFAAAADEGRSFGPACPAGQNRLFK